MYIIKYKDFIIESITKGLHYVDRTTTDNPESRANHRSMMYKNGWECKELLEVSKEGLFTGKKISLDNFLELYLKDNELLNKDEANLDFIDKVQNSIQYISNNRNVLEIVPVKKHSFINLGKIAFEIKINENLFYYSPVLIANIIKSKEVERQKGRHIQKQIKIKDIVRQGTNIWLVIKNYVAQTILFLPDGSGSIPLIKKTCINNRVEQKNIDVYELSLEEYIEKYVEIVNNFLNKNITYFLYKTNEWKEVLLNQIRDPKYQYYTKPIPQEWKNLFKKELVSIGKGTILYTPEFNIKIRIISDIVGYKKDEKAVEVKFEKIISKSAYKIRLGNLSIMREDNEVRKIGNLPKKGNLVKTYNIEGFTINGKYITAAARLVDAYVLDKNNNIIRSEYDENN
jgi:hypothetical protein